jgi:hypothetical protein
VHGRLDLGWWENALGRLVSGKQRCCGQNCIIRAHFLSASRTGAAKIALLQYSSPAMVLY